MAACRFCQEGITQTFVDLGVSPLANAYVKPERLEHAESYYPLHARVCASCLLVQLPVLQRPEEIFSDYAYFSSISTSWLRHAESFAAQATQRFNLDRHSLVMEIASNDGYLLQFFKGMKIPVLGIEPAANVARAAMDKDIPTRVAFFDTELATDLAGRGEQADLVIANNVIAHVPDLNDFVAGLAKVLKSQGALSLEFPHLMELIRQVQFDTIYHEHFSYFSFFTMERVLDAHGLAVFDVQQLHTHGGSLRVYAQHRDAGRRPVNARVDTLRQQEARFGISSLETYTNFATRVQQTKRSLLRFLIGAKDTGASVAGYGAPAKGNTLLNYCGVRTDFLDYTVDLSPHKQGLYLPGVRIPILAPEVIRKRRPDYVLILPWNLREEIIGQLAYIREWGGKFVVPIPETAVIP
jgi:SAM-dependent methyltransferase